MPKSVPSDAPTGTRLSTGELRNESQMLYVPSAVRFCCLAAEVRHHGNKTCFCSWQRCSETSGVSYMLYPFRVLGRVTLMRTR